MANILYRDPTTEKALSEKRSGSDRRAPTALWATLASPLRRRKSKGRRKTDPGAYVDIYDLRTWLIAAAILILSGIDALLTGLHMEEGTARELNPIMNAIIQHEGVPAFYAAKVAMTVLPLAVIFVHKEWTLGRFAAQLCLWSYLLLCCYHIYLVFLLHKV